mgnify:CR=1 FL=1
MIIALQYDILLVGNRQGVFFFFLSVSSLSPISSVCLLGLTWALPQPYLGNAAALYLLRCMRNGVI